MIKGLKIRPADIKDAEVVFHFIEELEEVSFDYFLFKNYYEQNIANRNFIYLVAEIEGVVIGYISCHGQILLHHLAKVFEIQELFVKKEYRGQKVGHLLLRKVEETLRQNDYHFLEVTANLKRIDTHLFYQNNGFTHTHQKFTKKLSLP